MAELSPLVWQWIQKAEEDWEAAGLLSALQSQASLLAAGAEIPRIHELVVLSEQLGAVDATWEWDPDGLDSLSTAAVASRYPGYAIGASDVAAALADAAAVRGRCCCAWGFLRPAWAAPESVRVRQSRW